MPPRTGVLLTLTRFCAVGTLTCLYFYGSRISVQAIQGLSNGTETGPLGDVYPTWTAIHFVSALVFSVLALFQLVSWVRNRYPLVHRLIGRIAVISGLLAAASASIIPFALSARPVFWRLYVLIQFMSVAALLILGFVAARQHEFKRHEAWMIRSLALAGAVITQRIVFPLFPKVFGIHSDHQFWVQFTCAAVLANVLNLAGAEWWLRSLRWTIRKPASAAEPMLSAVSSSS